MDTESSFGRRFEQDHGIGEFITDFVMRLEKSTKRYPEIGLGILTALSLIAIFIGAHIKYLLGDAVCFFLLAKFVVQQRQLKALEKWALPSLGLSFACIFLGIISGAPLGAKFMASFASWLWIISLAACTAALKNGVMRDGPHME